MKIKKGIDPKERAEIDNAKALAAKNADLIEYIAMMTEVEIPSEEENDNE